VTQFTCFTGPKVQILTQKSLPDLATLPAAPGTSLEQQLLQQQHKKQYMVLQQQMGNI
jgi:hypothetical protein